MQRAKARKIKNLLLKILVGINVIVFAIAAAGLDGEKSYTAYILCAISGSWLLIFIFVNYIWGGRR